MINATVLTAIHSYSVIAFVVVISHQETLWKRDAINIADTG